MYSIIKNIIPNHVLQNEIYCDESEVVFIFLTMIFLDKNTYQTSEKNF